MKNRRIGSWRKITKNEIDFIRKHEGEIFFRVLFKPCFDTKVQCSKTFSSLQEAKDGSLAFKYGSSKTGEVAIEYVDHYMDSEILDF